MEALIETIRLATASEATDEVRTAGAAACRTLLIVLEAKPGESLAPPVAASVPDSPIAAVVAGLRGVPVDQLLDLAIAKLRTLVPADVTPIAPRMSIPMIQVPRR